MVELLPCPFCGSDGKIDKHRQSRGRGRPDEYAYSVSCCGCEVQIGYRTIYTDEDWGIFDSEADAATAWNSRFPSPPTEQEG